MSVGFKPPEPERLPRLELLRQRAWRTTCATLGLRHQRTRAYMPRTNGKAERFTQMLLREWAYVEPYA